MIGLAGDGEVGSCCSLAGVKFQSCRMGEGLRVCFAQTACIRLRYYAVNLELAGRANFMLCVFSQ